jgi:hypothetical protein
VLFVALLLPARELVAETNPAIVQAREKVTRALSGWDLAKQKLAQTHGEAAALEHRIAAMKRLGNEAELERLLRESVAVETALRTATKAVDSRANEARRAIAETLAAIEARIGELKPRLKQGEYESRQAAARDINTLRDLHREVRGLNNRLKDSSVVPQSWSRYEVKIDPLDGPKELGEKADFIDDTRDRFQKKLGDLRKVLRDAREEQDIARAASSFQTDARLFDEEDRFGRVQKRAGGNADTALDERRETSGDPNPAPQAPQVGTPVADPNLGAFPPPAESPTDDTNARPGSAPQLGARTFEAAPLIKEVDPNLLLNLRVEALEGRTDIATLEQLVRDIERLERFLATRSGDLRRRAIQLKEDEARARAPAPR